ncbi:hypothetical protein PENTCL1PPCAC_19261, partial [Pristionchus entomophagus]
QISWRSNSRDTELLRRTWSEDFEDLYNIGSRIFFHLFGGPNGAACKALFPWIAKYEGEGRDYVDTNDFRTVAIFLEEVSDKEKIEVFLYKLGHRHESVHFGLNERINSLPQLTTEERKRAIHIWHETVVFIFHLVAEGFYDALKGFDRFPNI